MPRKLLAFFSFSKTAPTRKSDGDPGGGAGKTAVNKIFALLRTQIGHDFSGYKTSTILRRINRRMGLNQIESHDKYLRFLRKNPVEVETLFQELLIGVTRFFRDDPSFDVLKATALPAALEQMSDDDTFRAWIPGCSTGEEAYSVAMVLRELIDRGTKRIHLQLFGTDIDAKAIDRARHGLYPASIAADVSRERLNRFFVQEEGFFRVRKEIRDCVVFSVQDLIKDPPFSRLDLLSCRNVLIYLNAGMQKKLLPLFHYTLKSRGILMLGSSETIGGFTGLFSTLDKKWKIFKQQDVPDALRLPVEFPSGFSTPNSPHMPTAIVSSAERTDMGSATQRTVLERFSPTAVLVDAEGEILHIQGRTGKYLEARSGPPSRNLLDLAREGLRIELSSALRAAKTADEQVTRHQISVRTNGSTQGIDLHVCPLHSPDELAGKFLVVFEDIKEREGPGASDRSAGDSPGHTPRKISDLEKELQITRESHQVTIEELESSNEELKSTNEEMQSSNEELQSTNEELESSKEELQSLNEELQTVNAELQSKVEELSGVRDDMKNLLNSTEIATIFVDNEIRVKRFTSEALKIVNLIQTDIGRPLEHVVTNLNYDHLVADLSTVIKDLVPKEMEVQTTGGQWYNMRIMPYRTTDNRIDGCVVTFTSIAEQKKSRTVLSDSGGRSETALKTALAALDMNPEPLVVLDEKGRTLMGNTPFSRLMERADTQDWGWHISEVTHGIPGHTGIGSKLTALLENGSAFVTRSFALNTPEGEQRFIVRGTTLLEEKSFRSFVLRFVVKK